MDDNAVVTRQVDGLAAEVHHSFTFEYRPFSSEMDDDVDPGVHFGGVTVEYKPEKWVVEPEEETIEALMPDDGELEPEAWLSVLYQNIISALYPSYESRVSSGSLDDVPLVVTYNYAVTPVRSTTPEVTAVGERPGLHIDFTSESEPSRMTLSLGSMY